MLHTPIRRSHQQSRDGKVLLGCLVALGIFLALIITATVITVLNWRNIVSKGLTVGFDKVVASLPIEQSERDEIDAHIDRLVAGYKAKDISFEELFNVIGTLAEGPVLPVGIVTGAQAMYITPSALSDEEKLDAGVQLQRFAQGVYTEAIDPDAIGELLAPLEASASDPNTISLGVHFDASGKKELRIVSPETATIEQLKEVLTIARAKADEADIEEVVRAIDLSDEIGRAVDKALGVQTIEPAVVPDPTDDAVAPAVPAPAAEPEDGP